MSYAAAPVATSTSKQQAIGRRLRLHVALSAFVGSAASTLSAVLIAYAIIDIERRRWAQWFYAAVYALSAAVFGSSAGAEFFPDDGVRHAVVALCAATALLSYEAPLLLTVHRNARVFGLALLGTGLGGSLLLSVLVLLRLWLELRGVLPAGGAMEDGFLNLRQLLALICCALLEAGYFGVAVGLLEARPAPWLAMPHEAPAVVFPLAAAVGAACGAAVEGLRQMGDAAYVRGVELRVLGGGQATKGEQSALLGAGVVDGDEDDEDI